MSNTPPPVVNMSKGGMDYVKSILSNKFISNIRKTLDDEGNSFGSSNVIEPSLAEIYKNQEFDIVKIGANY